MWCSSACPSGVVFRTQVIGKVFERILASELKVSTLDCEFRSRYMRDSGSVFLGMHGTVDGWNPANQLRLGVYPIVFRVSYIPGGCLGIQPSTVSLAMFVGWWILYDLIKLPNFKPFGHKVGSNFGTHIGGGWSEVTSYDLIHKSKGLLGESPLTWEKSQIQWVIEIHPVFMLVSWLNSVSFLFNG